MKNIRLKRKLIILGFYVDYDDDEAYINAIGHNTTYRVNTQELEQYVNENFTLQYFDIYLFLFIVSVLKFIFIKVILFFPLCFFLMVFFSCQLGNMNFLLDELKQPIVFILICKYIFIFETILLSLYFFLMIFHQPFDFNLPIANLSKSSILKWLDINQL